MKAVVVERPGELSWREVGDPPQPGPYEALVRVESFAICNATDTHLRDCVFSSVTADNCPLLLGHEAIGEVVVLGPRCRYLQEGDRVLRPMVPLPGYNSFWGGFAEYDLVTDVKAYAEDGSPQIAATVFTGHQGQQVVPPEIPANEAVVLITLKEVLSYLDDLGVAHR